MLRSMTALVGCALVVLLSPAYRTLRAQSDQTAPITKLWSPSQLQPSADQIESIPGVKLLPIKAYEPEQDGYHWLHGVALAYYHQRLFVSFGHNRGSENTAGEEAKFMTSRDLGSTWSPLGLIDAGAEDDLAISHGVFLVAGGELFAFQGAFYGKLERVHTRGYRYNEATQDWQPLGVVVPDGFWPMQEPLRINGTWIMAGLHVVDGLSRFNDSAAVALSTDNDFTRWKLVVIPKPETMDLWGESTVLAVNNDTSPELLCISRYRQPLALAARSRNLGQNWSPLSVTNLHMTASKPYAGTLPDGRHFLLGTTTADNGNRRSPLTIALSSQTEPLFDRVRTLRDTLEPSHPQVESGPGVRLSYPYAILHEDRLLVGYSNDGGRGGNRNSAELAIIPLDLLTAVEH